MEFVVEDVVGFFVVVDDVVVFDVVDVVVLDVVDVVVFDVVDVEVDVVFTTEAEFKAKLTALSKGKF